MSTASVEGPHAVRPWGAFCLVIAGIVVMAIVSFFHLIGHNLPIWLIATPTVAGFLAAWWVLNDRRLEWENRLVWAAGLVFLGLAAVATAGVMILYVLPLNH